MTLKLKKTHVYLMSCINIQVCFQQCVKITDLGETFSIWHHVYIL